MTMPRSPRPSPTRARSTARTPRWWTAFGVALATVGCTPPGPTSPESLTPALRLSLVAAGIGAVSVLRHGDPGGTRVILVHGTPGSAQGWRDYVIDPPAGADVWALDRPGFGDSAPADAMPSLADQAAAVTALLPEDGRPVVLVGHSLGGAVVARVAADHPERVSALVWLAASLDPAQESIHPMQYLGAWAPVRALLPRALRNANAELMAFKPELEQLARDLPRITAKVVIVHGTEDNLVPVANVEFMRTRATGARCTRVRVLPGQNHFLPWNAVPEVRAAIASALDPAC